MEDLEEVTVLLVAQMVPRSRHDEFFWPKALLGKHLPFQAFLVLACGYIPVDFFLGVIADRAKYREVNIRVITLYLLILHPDIEDETLGFYYTLNLIFQQVYASVAIKHIYMCLSHIIFTKDSIHITNQWLQFLCIR